MLTLVTGGARSGKSRHAEALIADAPQVLYIVTSQIFDDEMAARIQHCLLYTSDLHPPGKSLYR